MCRHRSENGRSKTRSHKKPSFRVYVIVRFFFVGLLLFVLFCVACCPENVGKRKEEKKGKVATVRVHINCTAFLCFSSSFLPKWTMWVGHPVACLACVCVCVFFHYTTDCLSFAIEGRWGRKVERRWSSHLRPVKATHIRQGHAACLEEDETTHETVWCVCVDVCVCV